MDSTTLQATINSAAPGQLIQLTPDVYGNITIDNPPGNLTLFCEQGVTGEPNPGIQFSGNLTVRNVASDRYVLIRGIDDAGVPGLHIVSDNAGVVWFESCSFVGNATGLRVRDSEAVSIIHTTIEAQSAMGTGLQITSPTAEVDTSVAAWGSQVNGGVVALSASGATTNVFADDTQFSITDASGLQASLSGAQFNYMGTNIAPSSINLVSGATAIDEGCLPREIATPSAIQAGSTYALEIEGKSNDAYFVYVSATPSEHASIFDPTQPFAQCGTFAIPLTGAAVATGVLPNGGGSCYPTGAALGSLATPTYCTQGGSVGFGQALFAGPELDASCAPLQPAVLESIVAGAPTSVILFEDGL